jgi:hypothetical protein
MTVVAKFFVQDVQTFEGATASNVTLGAVCRGVENASWSAATPSGSISMSILNDAATGQFVKGQEYYVTFERAVKPEPHDGHTLDPVTDKWGNHICKFCGSYARIADDGSLNWDLHTEAYGAE